MPDKSNVNMFDELQEKEKMIASDNYSIYLRDIRKLSTLQDDELKALYQRMEEEPENKQELLNQVVEANLRLVLFFARKYLNRGLEFQDLIQFGNIGLVIAASKYDYRKGTRFSTLASQWIIHEIERSINLYARPVRLPENVILEQMLITKTEARMREELGRVPGVEEVAERLNTSVDRIQQMKMLKADALSLDATIVSGADTTFGEAIAGNMNVADQVIKGINADIIREILEALPEKERYILESRCGEKGSTLKELGDEFHISREAVRQKENAAKKKFMKILHTKELDADDLMS